MLVLAGCVDLSQICVFENFGLCNPLNC
jgi:hypothetical protein